MTICLQEISINESTNAQIQLDNFEEYAFHGFLAKVYDEKQRPTQAYVERDVRQLINLKNSTLFEKFLTQVIYSL